MGSKCVLERMIRGPALSLTHELEVEKQLYAKYSLWLFYLLLSSTANKFADKKIFILVYM